ncbi:hypothetical protein [Chitinophaga agrisoli]|nr:hypothetical protein [Chitinophaga agrisoli]
MLQPRKGGIMPYFRNFTYHIDKRKWKYYFLLATLAMDSYVK